VIQYKLLYDRVMLRELENERLTAGGLHIPDVVLDGTPYVKAEVIAIGHGRIVTGGGTEPLQVKVGDIVVWFKGGVQGGQIFWPGEKGPDGTPWKCWIITEPHIAFIYPPDTKAELTSNLITVTA
jgi:co-chaperonin GroES (HSP10)